MVDPNAGEEKSYYLNEFEMVDSTMALPNPSGANIVSDFTEKAPMQEDLP
jgi:hypothetical protein